MSNKPKVSVIGVGRLGLSFALLLDSKGYDVVGCDVNEKYINSLKDKTFNSKEPEVNELLKNSSMEFTSDINEALNHAGIIFVFVQTPSLESGKYNHKYVDQVVEKINSKKAAGKTLVIGCTVMPRYCESVSNKLKELNTAVIYNPEFIAQGNIMYGLKNADIVLIGGDYIPAPVFQIYVDIMSKNPNFKMLTSTGAEIAKISINCFIAMKIAFANLIGEIITNSWEEENINIIMDAIGGDSRIGNKYLSYGFPPGGPCIPRDARALNSHAFAAGVDTKFFHSIDAENKRHSEYLERYYTVKNPDKNVPFIFSYLSYKEGVDIITDSYQLKLCIDLLRAGYNVDVPIAVKEMDTPEEFKDYVYNEKVTFGKNPENGYKIN